MSDTTHIKRDGTPVPPVFWTFYLRLYGMINSNQILHVDETRWEEIFTWWTSPSALDKNWHVCSRAICLR